MVKYYNVLGLEEDSSIADVEEKYQILIKEFDPNVHEDDLKDYFKLELEKVKDAYSKILLNHKKHGLDAFLNEDHEPITIPKTIADSYKLLKLEEDATLGEISNKYKVLIEEFNPDYHSQELKDFFKKEQDKITDSYQKIITYLSTLNDQKENNTSEQIDSTNNENSTDFDSNDQTDDEVIDYVDDKNDFNESEYNVKSNSELYSDAWKSLSGYWGICTLFNIIYMIIAGIASNLLIIIIVGGALQVGVSKFYLNVSRSIAGSRFKPEHDTVYVTGEIPNMDYLNPKVSNLFYGFNFFASSLIAHLLIFISVIIGTLFFVIPGIYLGLSYSMTYYVIADNPGISAVDAMKKSRLLMNGNVLKLFFFLLMSLFLFILGLIPFGLGLFVVIPWFYVAHAKFYENLLISYKDS